MAVGTLLLIILFVVGVVLVTPFVVAYAQGSDKREEIREVKAEAALARSREKIATKALRAILNGAGNPVLEAQDAMDKIDLTYDTKELN